MASSSLAQPGSAQPGTPPCRPTGASITRRWRATSSRRIPGGAARPARLYVALHGGSSPRDWPTGWRSSSPTGSRRTPSSTARCWPMADAWRQRTGGRVLRRHQPGASSRRLPARQAGPRRAFRRDRLFGGARRVQAGPRVLHQRPGAHGRDGGAVDLVRRRYGRQCRRRADLRLARHALSRAGEPGAGAGEAGARQRRSASPR